MKNIKTLFFFCFVLFFLCSCATSLKVAVQRPAELDLDGANSICVVPFSFKNNFFDFFGHPSGETISDYLTEKLQDRLLASNYFKVINPNRIGPSMQQESKAPCDVYITGSVYNFYDRIHPFKKKYKVKDKDGKEKERIKIEYERDIYFTVGYKVINSQTQEIIFSSQKNFDLNSYRYDEKWELPSVFSMAQNEMDSLIKDILNKLEPYTITRRIPLLKDKSDNPQMEYADSLAKEGDITLALAEFLEVYESTDSFEAGYNASRILEAQGNFAEAEKIMLALYQKTGNKKALQALNEIRYEMQCANKLQKQIAKKQQKDILMEK